jgi:hypothetical protein
MSSSADTPATSNDNFGGPSANVLKSLASSLTEWRSLLPDNLQWAEDDPMAFPAPQPARNVAGFGQIDPELSPQHAPSRPPLFSTNLDVEPMNYPYLYDIQVAMLRTRYYYVKYMVHRPFIYKALHFPEQMTQEDAEGAAECLRVSFVLQMPLSFN